MRVGDLIDKKLVRNIDLGIVLSSIALIVIGFIAIASASGLLSGGSTGRLKVQVVAAIIGIFAVLVIVLFDYNTFGEMERPLYILNVLLLLSVFAFGTKIKGSLSWIELGPINFQPSEVVKIGFILVFAKHLERRKDKLNNIIQVIPSLIYMAVPIGLIMLQPDFGTAIVFVFIACFMLFEAGLSYKIIAGAIAGIVALVPILWLFFLKIYQKNRILTFLNPELDPMGSGYHVIQSKIAIGSGLFTGKGIFHGTQNNLGFIPERQTDFIFSVIGEEVGFVGCVIVVLLFIFLLYRIMSVARSSKNDYGTLVCTGIMAMYLFHILENIGMTIQLMPVTGIPLPFVSYGGSSLLTNMIALGIVINIGMRRQLIRF